VEAHAAWTYRTVLQPDAFECLEHIPTLRTLVLFLGHHKRWLSEDQVTTLCGFFDEPGLLLIDRC
jgi:hypothetical protein